MTAGSFLKMPDNLKDKLKQMGKDALGKAEDIGIDEALGKAPVPEFVKPLIRERVKGWLSGLFKKKRKWKRTTLPLKGKTSDSANPRFRRKRNIGRDNEREWERLIPLQWRLWNPYAQRHSHGSYSPSRNMYGIKGYGWRLIEKPGKYWKFISCGANIQNHLKQS